MTWAVCANCGAMKRGAWCPCPECGVQFFDIDLGLALSEHCLPKADLQRIADAVWVIRNSGWGSDERISLLVYYLSWKWPGVIDPDIQAVHAVEPRLQRELEAFYQARLAHLPGPEAGKTPADWGQICPCCRRPIRTGQDLVVCSGAGCRSPHHRECWEENQGCSAFGCPGAGGTASLRGAPEERPVSRDSQAAPGLQAGVPGARSGDTLPGVHEAGTLAAPGTHRGDTPPTAPPKGPATAQAQDRPLELDFTAEGEEAKRTLRVRPWVRLLARAIDLHVFAVFCAFMLLFVPLEILFAVYNAPLFLVILGVMLLWVLAEPILLATWGTTFGKWLFNTEVCDLNGDKLSYTVAMKRSFRVLNRGLAFAVPIISQLRMYAAYKRLRERKKTEWDEALGVAVIHGPIGVSRGFLAGAIVAVLLLMAVWSY